MFTQYTEMHGQQNIKSRYEVVKFPIEGLDK